MIRLIIVAAAMLFATAALAQTPQTPAPPDPAVLQRMVETISAQRNQAMNAATEYEAKLAVITGELTRATARIKELETASKAEK
jgi:hypothetical protein